MNIHSVHLEQSDASAFVRTADASLCSDVSPLKDGDALYILRAMSLNDFENLMNALEHFLGHVDIIDSNPTFKTAAAWMSDLIDRFGELDTSKEESINLNKFNDKCQDAAERNWIDCHFDALTRAGLIHSHDGGLTLSSLRAARDIFRGLAFVQSHLPDVLRGRKLLTAELIEQFAVQNASHLSTDDYISLRQLADYLKRLHAHHLVDAEQTIARKMDAVTPELLWPEAADVQK